MGPRIAMRASARRARGVSLVEALVALAVMGFGILGVVALQVSMRLNADVAKQRTEAIRLASEAIERRRSFSVIAATPGEVAWNDVATIPSEDIAGTNATFTRTITVTPVNDFIGKTVAKHLVVLVQWTDRANVQQSVRLATTLHSGLPLLAVTTGVPPVGGQKDGSPVRKPLGRHPGIPPAATDQGDGTSEFAPPGGGTLRWVFDNGTGVIKKICTSPTTCTNGNYQLLAGFVDFATDTVQPTGIESEAPSSTAFALDVTVNVTATLPNVVTCYKDLATTYVAYFCAIAVDPTNGSKWSGRAELGGGSLVLASSLTDASVARHRVCRYTPVRDCQPVMPADENAAFPLQNGTTIWGTAGSTLSCSGADPTPKRKLFNVEHPLDYLNVKAPLVNQNFLVIRAGDGASAFTCPQDNASTTDVNGNTWHHQPAS